MKNDMVNLLIQEWPQELYSSREAYLEHRQQVGVYHNFVECALFLI
jgi:hypothetical protein